MLGVGAWLSRVKTLGRGVLAAAAVAAAAAAEADDIWLRGERGGFGSTSSREARFCDGWQAG